MGVDDKAKVKVIDTTVKESEDEDEDQDDNAPPEPAAKDARTRRRTRPSRKDNERPLYSSSHAGRAANRTGRRATASPSSL